MKQGNGHDLEWLLNYELKQSVRHRRFVSIVMLSANGNTNKLDKVLKDIGRDSDPFFLLPDSFAVLMGETDRSGALKAVERFREIIGEAMDVRYSVASFPDDGKAPDELTHAAQRRMSVANTMDHGSVVDRG